LQLLLLCDIQQQDLGQGQTPLEVLYKGCAAKKLRDLTKTVSVEVNAQACKDVGCDSVKILSQLDNICISVSKDTPEHKGFNLSSHQHC